VTDRQPLLLLLTYFLLASFFLARACFIELPHIVTDEVQYRLLAENLHRYGHFLLRGHFPTTIAPLYPMLLALWEYLPFQPDHALVYQSLNALLFAAALFPLYLTARLLAFSPLKALSVAGLALLLPHSFYVATCMSENLYFPLALTFIYLVFRLLTAPALGTTFLMGAVGAALLWTKTSGAFLLLSVALFWPVVVSFRKETSHLFLLALVLAAILYAPWVLIKHFALSGSATPVVGVYAKNWQVVWQRLFSFESLRMLAVYAADFVFATALLPWPLLAYHWLRFKDPRRPLLSYLFLLSGLLIVVAALFSGLNSGWLRERHLFLVFPYYLLFSFYVWPHLEGRKRGLLPWIWVILLCLATWFELYDFQVASPTLESPWVNLVVLAYRPLCRAAVVYQHFSLCLLPFVLLAGLTLLRGQRLLALWCALFWLIPSQVTIFIMHQSEKRLSRSPEYAIVRWVKHELGPGGRLLVTGRHAYFEPRFLQRELDGRLVEWNEAFGLRPVFTYRLEMAGLYDLRMIDSLSELRHLWPESRGLPLLTALELPESRPLTTFAPLKLYRLHTLPSGWLYRAEISPFWFFTQTGHRRPLGPYRYRIESSRRGWAVYGPYLRLPRGRYEVRFLLHCPEQTNLMLDVYDHSLGRLVKKPFACYQERRPTLIFVAREPRARYEFRVFLMEGTVIFSGVELSLMEGGK